MEAEPETGDFDAPTPLAHATPPAPGVGFGVRPRNIHRIGGASIENLRLKAKEATLNPPGISVIQAPTPGAAREELRRGLPRAKKLLDQAKTIGSATVDAIRTAGFDVVAAPSAALPNHHRLFHPQGAAGFSEENLTRLAEAFVNTTENES